MKIGLYNSTVDDMAVADISAVVLASALSYTHETEIVRTSRSTPLEGLSEYCGSSLDQVSFRTIEPPPQITCNPDTPARKYQTLRDWSYSLSQPYDLFINFADRLPLHCAAPKGVLAIQFPNSFIPLTYRFFWHEHLSSYQLKLVSSYHTQFWTRFFWDSECKVVYPPVPSPASLPGKQNLIVCAGSFNAKRPHKMLELISAYKKIAPQLPGWKFMMLGDLDLNTVSRNRLEWVRDAASEIDVPITVNPSLAERGDLLSRARMFWQAEGLGEDLYRQPQLCSPFNLPVVEALLAGCVPIVTNSGSLSEAILTGDNGFFWEDPEELIQQTLSLAKDEQRLTRIAKASRISAKKFLPERFVSNFLRHLHNEFQVKPGRDSTPIGFWKRLTRSFLGHRELR
jgi:glycosyltransferase involved in cell wall biosynthesis